MTDQDTWKDGEAVGLEKGVKKVVEDLDPHRILKPVYLQFMLSQALEN